MTPSRVGLTALIVLAMFTSACSSPAGPGSTQQSAASAAESAAAESTAAESTAPESAASESNSADDAGGATFTVEQANFQVRYRLDGSVVSSSAVGIDVPAGTRFSATADSNTGTTATAGQRIGTLSVPEPTGQDDGTVDASLRALVRSRVGPVVAPVAGAVTSSATSVRIATAGLDLAVPLKPLQELRYRGMRFTGTATVETVLGQRNVPCQAVWVEPVQQDEEGATAMVRCRLAPSVETAAGIPAVLTLTSSAIPDAVTVPVIYVGLDAAGKNYVARVRDGATFTHKPVVVGPTDGVRRVVISGLSAGDVLAPAE